MSINWYPGHMAKTRRLMIDDMKHVDAVCEILDARIPNSSRNPDLNYLAKFKRRMIVLNRVDLADPAATAEWVKYYKKKLFIVIETNSQKGGFNKDFIRAVRELCAEKIARDTEKGQIRPVRSMIFGIPNVGKSSFINRLLGRAAAIAADKPGVTRQKQWFTVDGFDFMDTPGMLWPKIESDEQGYNLAFTGTIKDDIIDLEDLACRLIDKIDASYADLLVKHYSLTEIANKHIESNVDNVCETGDYSGFIQSPQECSAKLEAIAKARGCIISGGLPDTQRASRLLIDDFRSGKLGRLTLEWPDTRKTEPQLGEPNV